MGWPEWTQLYHLFSVLTNIGFRKLYLYNYLYIVQDYLQTEQSLSMIMKISHRIVYILAYKRLIWFFLSVNSVSKSISKRSPYRGARLTIHDLIIILNCFVVFALIFILSKESVLISSAPEGKLSNVTVTGK